MRAQIQLILATIALTVLIWVYADQQGWRVVQFPVAVQVSTVPDVVVQLVGATEGGEQESSGSVHVMVTARGPNAAIQQLNLSRVPVFDVTVPVTEIANTDTPRVLDIHDAVAAALRDHGLQLVGLSPPSITVKFDRKVRMNVELQVGVGAFAEALKGTLKIEPPTVTAIALNSELKSAPSPIEPRLMISIEDELRSQPPGQGEFDFTISLKSRKLQGLNVTWEPDTVRVKGQLKQMYEDVELKLIPLRVLLPWNWPADKYDIVWVDERDRLQKVELKIPVGKPSVLTNKDVTAYIQLDDSMIPPESPEGASQLSTATQPAAEPSPYTQTVRFVFPPGFEDVKVVSPPATVKFRIVKRQQQTGVTGTKG